MSGLQSAMLRARAMDKSGKIEIAETPHPTGVIVHRQTAEPKGVVVYSTVAQIILAVSDRLNVSREDIISQRRQRESARARQIVMYLAKRVTLRNYNEIGKILGDRDHATIMHGVSRIAELRKTDEKIDAACHDLEELLKPRFQ